MIFRFMGKKNIARRLGFGLFFVLMPVTQVAAQSAGPPTNIEVYQNLAVDCLAAAAVPDSFRLSDDGDAPYLRGALLGQWLEEGRFVYQNDTTSATRPLHRMMFEADRQALSYHREGRRVRRHVELGLRYEITAPDGRLAAASRCDLRNSDVLDRSDIPRVDDSRFSATTAEVPAASWRRRYLEPVIVGAATAVTVVLFFTLRSKRTSTE